MGRFDCIYLIMAVFKIPTWLILRQTLTNLKTIYLIFLFYIDNFIKSNTSVF